MLSFCEKVFDGPVDTLSSQYTPESTWKMLGQVDQLYIQVRGGQSTVANVVITVQIELSNDGQSFASKIAPSSVALTLGTAGAIGYTQLADGGTSPNGCYVRLKVTATVGAANCTVWVAGRTQ